MSQDETTKLLHSTTDAQVWAKEWCRIAREIDADPERGPVIDEGWMIGWFANAMMVAHDAALRPTRQGDAVSDEGGTVVSKWIGPHPCPVPTWGVRRRLGIALGDHWRCDGCNQEWEWNDWGWFDTWKDWHRVGPYRAGHAPPDKETP